ncbi:hypothetical protein ANN_13271 [Periplaneta americana]|uniref:Uncharacterized protein n=1 Tax=Periplaneta americana TaxID=6978 RepID=A0ABQ8TIX3_PERAM|nr:hypothetical protein ANN_13271 [Periplaneta americana]
MNESAREESMSEKERINTQFEPIFLESEDIVTLSLLSLRKKGLTVHEEVHGISQEGFCRRNDMLAIPPGSTSAYIIDPTVRFEAQEQQHAEVHAEKKARIYEPTVSFYLEKYHLTSIVVVGLTPSQIQFTALRIQDFQMRFPARPTQDFRTRCLRLDAATVTQVHCTSNSDPLDTSLLTSSLTADKLTKLTCSLKAALLFI